MNAKRTIEALLDGACEAAHADRFAEARKVARMAWVKETMAKIRAADEAVDEAWQRRLEAWEDEGLSDEEIDALGDLPDLPEEEARDALMAQVNAVCDHDRWPRECHWGGI